MKMLMLALPHMVRDLIAPEVSRTDWYVLEHTSTYMYERYYLCMYMYRPVGCLPSLQQKAVDLLDLLKKNLPDKTGEKAGWNF